MINVRKYLIRIQESIGGAVPSGLALFVVMFFYWIQQPLILSDFGVGGLFNQSVALAIVAMAQTLVVVSGAIDLSVGSLIGLTACFAATYMGDSVVTSVGIIVASLLLGAMAGSLNGVLVAHGKLEPLIATLTTSFVFQGVALILRPTPGGSVAPWFSSALTGRFGYFPASANATEFWQSERTLDFDFPFFTNGFDEFCRVLSNGAISSGTFKQHFERLRIVVHGLCRDLADQSILKVRHLVMWVSPMDSSARRSRNCKNLSKLP